MTPTIQIEDRLVSSFEGECERRVEQLEAIVVLDFRESYKDDGARTMLSWDKIRWLSLFVTFAEDVEWSERAIGMSVREIRTEAQSRIRLTRDLSDAAFRRRYLRARRDQETGHGRLWGLLSDAEFEIVMSAIDRRAKQWSDGRTFEQRRADALVELCSMAIGADADPDRATIVCHTDLDALVESNRNGMLACGTFVAPETVRRLSCDSRVQMVIATTDGLFISSKVKRTVSPYLFRQLKARDQVCVFPGCDNDIWVDAHHIIHWADLGPTELDNLALLCGFHHQLMHEGGWNMHVTAEGDFVFIKPDGTPLFAHARESSVSARAP